jgi:hypothetical protein
MNEPTVTVSRANAELQARYDRLMDSAASAHSLVMLSDRVTAIESIAADKIQAFDRWQARQDEQLAELTDRIALLERLAQGII